MPETYKDSNGVTWLLVTSGSQIFGTMDPESSIRYDPEPPDTTIAKAQKGDAVGEREKKIVRAAIEAYAALHSKGVVLRVTERATGAGWAVLALALALLWADDIRDDARGAGRRRRR